MNSFVAFRGSSSTPITDLLAESVPFLFVDGELSGHRYAMLLIALLFAQLIPLIFVSKMTGQGTQGALRNSGIFMLGALCALTPLTMPICVGLWGYAWYCAFLGGASGEGGGA
ncbi:hypothetical protein VDS42_22585 [Xanthomonas campestris pv. campestris]|nr:hypothetical protein [Xanthomonas campestris pv. campestris]